MNLLFVTLDQLRADTMGAAGHPLVATPTLDGLCAEGVRFARHYAQAAPCSPGRAALYTGTYQMNNRVVANGTPLSDRFDNVARVLRRAGFDPTLFGYTDIGFDPMLADGPEDARLDNYDGLLPGFSIGLFLPEDQSPWLAWLAELGYDDLPAGWVAALEGEPDRPAAHSHAAFLTERFVAWLGRQPAGWCAHLSYLRPHSPYAAAGEYARRYDPADVPLPIPAAEVVDPLHAAALRSIAAAPHGEAALRHLRAQYYGMVTEVDAQLGRALDAVRARGEWGETVVVVTADHGEQLGDHGLIEKLGYFEQSYHSPLIVRDPSRPEAHGSVVTAFTESVDVLPTICELVDAEIPAQVDGLPLSAFLRGTSPPWWRDAAHWEWDWRYLFLGRGATGWPTDRRLERQNLAVVRTDAHAYVQFGDGTWRCFDLGADPTWRTEDRDPDVVLPLVQRLAGWRQEHLDRRYPSLLLSKERLGRWPALARRDTAAAAGERG